MATKDELKKKFSAGKKPTGADFAELIDGAQGERGATGDTGLPGVAGIDGLPGRDGVDGSGAITSVNGKVGVITGLAEQSSVNELATQLADKATLNDAVTAADKVWSSEKTAHQIQLIPKGDKGEPGTSSVAIDDTLTNTLQTWSSQKMNTSLLSKEEVKTSTKNLFDPSKVLKGQAYLNSGAVTNNASYNVTPKYPAVAGEVISISGMDKMGRVAFPNIHFWNGVSGVSFVSIQPLPAFITTDSTTFTMPANANHFTVNINQAIPNRLQIEKSAKPTNYQPFRLLEHGVTTGEIEGEFYSKSTKNLYDGKVAPKLRMLNTGIQDVASENDCVSSFVPVEFGKYYTISSLDPTVSLRNILGYSSNTTNNGGTLNFVKLITVYSGDKATFYIDDANIKFVIFPMSSLGTGTYQGALNNSVQFEEGQVVTSYEPYQYSSNVQRSIGASARSSETQVKASQSEVITNFVELNKVRVNKSVVGMVAKDISPLGISYSLSGAADKDSESNNLFTQYKAIKSETKQIFVNMANFIADKITVGKLKATPFTVPSGQFDNGDSLPNWDTQFNKDDYCHPDAAYDEVGVAGFKYWMIASVLPSGNAGDVVWEDEDMFVSNDAKTWLRIKSFYEAAKTYTAPTLSLPPQTLATTNSRKYAFLPCPAKGDDIEISVPADNGGVALDRVTIKLTELPWKHDPAIIIDGGYVYTYHSFHLPYVDRAGGKNRFIVCVRTNDGVNWEVVRTDGSTMLLTEETSRQIFTKDVQGRYNYMYYAYNRSYSNPKILKYGDGDYEFAYGFNFNLRFKGATPYNFDFSKSFPMQDVSSGNHPGLLLDGSNLYQINNETAFVSTNRGETFTPYTKYPAWLGGVSGMSYKKTLCKGESGKVILVEAQRQHTNSALRPVANAFSATSDVHQMFIYEYASVGDFVNKAQNGLVDGYVDLQIVKVNFDGLKRSTRFYPAISNNATTTIVNRPLQRIKVADIQVEKGDTLFLYVTLNSRNGAKIIFGGIDIV